MVLNIHKRFTHCLYLEIFKCLFLESDLPENIAGYWVFTDDQNFNTGYPKATLERVTLTDFEYWTSERNVKSKAPTLTGKWAPIWTEDDKGEIMVRKA